MRAKFIGNGDSDPASLTFGGVVFPVGKVVEVPAAFEAKVRGNSHFEVVKGRGPAKVKPDDEDGE